MSGINGIGGIPGPVPVRSTNVRGRDGGDTQGAASVQDDVAISDRAKGAAEVARLTRKPATGTEVRAERVAAAKQNIQNGNYKRPDVIAQVAERIGKYLGQ